MTTAPAHPAAAAAPPTPTTPTTPESGSALSVKGAPMKPSLPAPHQWADAPLPHEFDQALGQVAAEPDPIIVQAKRDLDAGMVDTDMRVTPGLDAERRARLVPEPAGKPEVSPAAGAKPRSGRVRTG